MTETIPRCEECDTELVYPIEANSGMYCPVCRLERRVKQLERALALARRRVRPEEAA